MKAARLGPSDCLRCIAMERAARAACLGPGELAERTDLLPQNLRQIRFHGISPSGDGVSRSPVPMAHLKSEHASRQGVPSARFSASSAAKQRAHRRNKAI
jgi:hypothetical protein